MKQPLWCMLLLPVLASAQPQNCQTELSGFLLGQNKSALASLGAPFKIVPFGCQDC